MSHNAYQIIAYSPSLNEWQQEIDLENGCIYDEALAQTRAEWFCRRYNQQQYMGVQDWQPQIKYNTNPLA
jgi:hypothetical protein